ncbi:MAG: threonine/serine dehydratase [Thaumarchaeota archaeon]|nr:threonine/serine dehydratase [Nitrososphaerota archaeon]
MSLTENMNSSTVKFEDIEKARERIRNYVFRTPLYSNLFLSKRTGADIFVKLECYQPTGVFKIRGAFNIELKNLNLIKERGVVTASSGNHGLSVAYAAKTLGVDCSVVVTKGANPDKIKMIKLFGANVIEDGPTSDSIITRAHEFSAETGRFFIHPFDDPDVISGQGTCGLEMVEEKANFDTLIVPVGGGGLISGISTAVRAMTPECKIIGVEATGVPSLFESMKENKLVTVEDPKTIADGLLGQTIGKLNFEICRKNVDEVVLVSDDSMRQAVKSLLFDSHLLTEPSGAAPAAALLSGVYKPKPGERIGLVISGGNISYKLLLNLLTENYQVPQASA